MSRAIQDRRQAGFTAVEAIVVAAIMGIMFAVAILSQSNFVPSVLVNAGARQVMTDVRLTRAKALSQNAQFRIVFVANATGYMVQRRNPTSGDWEEYALYGRDAAAVTPGTVQWIDLPEQTRIVASIVVTFTPRGTATVNPNGNDIRVRHRTDTAVERQIAVTLAGNTQIL